jgi:two-component system, probable response regulator PhcQ
LQVWGPPGEGAEALRVLAEVLDGDPLGDKAVLVPDPLAFTALLTAPAGQVVTAAQCAWLAWLLWQKGLARVEALDGGFRVSLVMASALPGDWLADAMERLSQVPA